MKDIPPAFIVAGAIVLIFLTSIILVEIQHRGMVRLTPLDLPYGLMRAGENVVALYRFNKTEWQGELLAYRTVEIVFLKDRCPECIAQIQALELERQKLIDQILLESNLLASTPS